MAYQAFHSRPIVSGNLPRRIGKSLYDRIDHRDLVRQHEQLAEAKVKYIVVHGYLWDEYDRSSMERYRLEYEVVYEDDSSLVCRVY